MPAAPAPITAAPALPWQPWADVGGEPAGRWVPVESGPADRAGQVAAEFEDGPDPWKQV